MIPLPTPPVRGQRIQADLLRDLIAAVRRCRPIQGQGILLQETLQGTVIALAGRPKTATAETFDHRFKVSLRVGGEADAPTYALHIRKGSLFAVEGEVATEQPLALEGLAQDPDDADAWRVAAAPKGSLYIRKDTEEGKQGYSLAYGEPKNALFTIADFTPSESSSNPAPVVTQRLLGDLYAFFGDAEEMKGVAWRVRKQGGQWEIYAPYWAYGRTQTLVEGAIEGWNTLDETLSSGTLYACMRWNGTKDADTGAVSWEPDERGPQLTNSASDIPADADPSGEGSSATPGVRVRVVKIGAFSADGLTFDQFHEGVIVEDFNAGQGTPGKDGAPGKPGEDGEDGQDGQDGATYVPSLREEGGTGGGVYLDFTNSKTGQTIQGSVNLKGDKGDPGEPGKDGTFDPGTALSLEVVTGVTYDTSTHKLQMTKRTIRFYGVSAGTQKTVDITTATAHSAEHEG